MKDSSELDEALKAINKSPELNYMTQIVFMLFEDMSKPLKSKERFRVDLRFSPGIKSRQEILFPNEEESDLNSPNSETDLQKKSSPDLPFVRRLPAGLSIDQLVNLTKKTGDEGTSPKVPTRRQSLESKSESYILKQRIVPSTGVSILGQGKTVKEADSSDSPNDLQPSSLPIVSSASDSAMLVHTAQTTSEPEGDIVAPHRKILFSTSPGETMKREPLGLSLFGERGECCTHYYVNEKCSESTVLIALR